MDKIYFNCFQLKITVSRDPLQIYRRNSRRPRNVQAAPVKTVTDTKYVFKT